MNKKALVSTLLGVLMVAGTQASAASSDDAAKCVVGTGVGAIVGGLLGNVISHGDQGATAAGAIIGGGTGAVAGCTDAQVSVEVGGGNPGSNYHNGGGNHNGGGYHNGGDGGDWNGGGYDQDERAPAWLVKQALRKAINKSYVGKTTVYDNDDHSVVVRTSNERYSPRKGICRDFSLKTFFDGDLVDQTSGRLCQSEVSRF
jgi:hypothetical protein